MSFAAPFRIGIRPITIDQWLTPSKARASRIAAKRQMLADGIMPYQTVGGTNDAETDVQNLLSERFSGVPDDHPPLLAASLMVEDDLVLMRRTAEGWVLAAAALFFPTSWRLEDKLGKPLGDVHAPVPAFATGSRHDEVIGRMFDALQPMQPVARGNWSVHSSAALRITDPHGQRVHHFETGGPLLPQATLRRERQSLLKLPMSGDILFSISIDLDPLTTLSARECHELADQIDAMDAEQSRYKGLSIDREQLVRELRAVA